MKPAFLLQQPIESIILQMTLDVEAWSLRREEFGIPPLDSQTDSLLAAMRMKPSVVLETLRQSDPKLRVMALAVLGGYWVPRPAFADACLTVAFRDEDSRVRGAALSALPRFRHFIDDPCGHLGQLLAALPQFEESRTDFIAQLEALSAKVVDQMDEELQHLAGDHLTRMLESETAAVEFLANEQSSLRCAAIEVIARYWPNVSSFGDLCERMAFLDPDPDVRLVALDSWVELHANTDEPRVGRVLADIVRNLTWPAAFRNIAYYGLHLLRGTPPRVWAHLMMRKELSTGLVDWYFVDSFF